MGELGASGADDRLDANDRLSLQIGRVARAHVALDQSLRQVHQALAGPGLAVYLTGAMSSTLRLIQDCREMLKHAGLAPDVYDAATKALSAATSVNEDRNRVVHDMWINVDFSPQRAEVEPTWQSYRFVKGSLGAVPTPREVTYVDDVLAKLRRANARIFGLRSALWETLPFFKGSMLDDGHLDEWILIMNDSFELTSDGGIKPHPTSKS